MILFYYIVSSIFLPVSASEVLQSVVQQECSQVPIFFLFRFHRPYLKKTTPRARILSIGGGIICIIMVIPAIYFGAVAKATNWDLTDFPCGEPKGKIVVPAVLQVQRTVIYIPYYSTTTISMLLFYIISSVPDS